MPGQSWDEFTVALALALIGLGDGDVLWFECAERTPIQFTAIELVST